MKVLAWHPAQHGLSEWQLELSPEMGPRLTLTGINQNKEFYVPAK